MRIAVLVLLATASCAPSSPAAFDGDAALALVEAQVNLGPRYPGSPGHVAVQEWIVDELSRTGWVHEVSRSPYRGVTLHNISGRLPGASGSPILVGAHYDTRRVSDRSAVSPDVPGVGANDGASGVAVLLELARVLKADPPGCDLQLVFFDGEDNGGLDGWEWAAGSRAYAADLAKEPEAVVIVDMVGDRDLRLPIERMSTPDLAAEIWEAARRAGSRAFVDELGVSILDDHAPFLERGWRAVDIIDIQYPYWHTPDDTLDKVSAESLEQVGRALVEWLRGACPKESGQW